MTFDSEKCDNRDRHEVQWPHQTDMECSVHIRPTWSAVATTDWHEVEWPHQTDMKWPHQTQFQRHARTQHFPLQTNILLGISPKRLLFLGRKHTERIRNGKFTSFVFLFFFTTTKRISKKFGIKSCTINFEIRHSLMFQGRNMSSAVQYTGIIVYLGQQQSFH